MPVSHQNARLGPGRHPRPGKVVCVMELASMLSGERFGDRPVSVCPVIGAILRVYNDNVDDRRRQDLYRFAADAVDTRLDYRVQRQRADAALEWAGARYGAHAVMTPPDPEGPRDEIAYFVVGALSGRPGRWSDEEHTSMISLLDDLIELGAALVGDLLEEIVQPVEHGGGYHEFILAEGLQGRAEPRLEARPALLDQPAPAVGERREHDAPVAVGALALYEAGGQESFQHLGHARRAQVGGIREVAHRHLSLVAKPEQQAVLRVGELARSVGLASAQPSHRSHRALERSRDLLGGAALLALAYHVARRA
jgi:hypothetical protein